MAAVASYSTTSAISAAKSMAVDPPSASISDADADGDDDVEMIEEPGSGLQEDEELEEDAEGESEEEEDQEEDRSVRSSSKEDDQGHDAESDEGDAETDTKYHGAVKVPEGESLNSGDEEDEDEDSNDEESVDNAANSDESEDSSESDADNDWEKEQSVGREAEVANNAARNDCVFCGQDEDNDPGEVYEENLSCAVCGDNSHRQCAREHNTFKDETTDPASWKCQSCIENGLEAGMEAETNDQELSIQRRLSISSSRITRDLLPAARGTPKPGSHSIFDTLILEDDPGDGARALRKRKSDEAMELGRSRSSSKRPKTSDSKREETLSPMATGRAARSTTTASRTRRASATAAENRPEAEEPTAATTSRPQRQRRPKKEETPHVRLVRRSQASLILAFKVDLSRIDIRPLKRKRTQRRPRQSRSVASALGAPLHALTPYTTPYYAFHDRENDDSKKPPYGGILKEEEADTSQTMPTTDDRAKFEFARQQAEEDWKRRSAAAEAEQETKGRASQKVSGPPSKIKSIIFGKWEIDTWYAAPYPEEYSRNRVLYICEFCLKYMGSDFVAWRHKLKCPCKHPPGDEIYRDGSISVFEVDGRKNPAYCQNLCLLAKLFLGSKTLYYDVEPFLFYIMTEYDKHGYHFVGYFSKEKRPSSMNNVSCILTMPHHQRKGYGHLLIDFSYLLTRKEGRTGSPEKPLSDMGLVSYRNYWRLQLCYLLIDAEPGTDTMSVRSISDMLGMTPDDVISQLEALRVLVRDPVTKSYAFRLDKSYFREAIDKWEAKGYQRLNADRLVWTPYIMSRTSNLAIFDRPPISTVAPREDGEDEDIMPEDGVQQQQLELDKAAIETKNGISAPDFVANGTSERPGTPIQGVSEMALSSPAKPLALTLTNGNDNTELENAPQSPIPPWRYELWPPVPGTIYRSRRGGYRPKGSRITAHGTIFSGNTGATPAQQATPRGSRTSLRVSNKAGNGVGSGASALNSEPGDMIGEDSARASPSARRSTRSRVGTPSAKTAVGGLDGVAGEHDDDDEEDEEEEEEEEEDEDEEEEEDEIADGDDESAGNDEEEDEDEDEDENEGESAEEDTDRDENVLGEDAEEREDGDADADEDYEDAEEDVGEDEDEDEDEDVAMDD